MHNFRGIECKSTKLIIFTAEHLMAEGIHFSISTLVPKKKWAIWVTEENFNVTCRILYGPAWKLAQEVFNTKEQQNEHY